VRRWGAAVMLGGGALLATLPAGADPTKHECVAANDAGQELRRAGKLHEARARYASCVATSCPRLVRADCAKRLDEVEKALPTIVFEVKDGAGADVTDVRVAMDGTAFADRLAGTAIAVDPGDHRFLFQAEGMPDTEREIVVRESEKNRHERVVLAARERLPGDSSQRTAQTTAEVAPQRTAADAQRGRGQRVSGLVLAGAGAVGLVVGGAFGLVASSTYDRASPGCRAQTSGCSLSDQSDSTTAHAQALVSTVGFVAGGVLLATGMVLYLAAPKGGLVAVTPAIGAGWGGVGLRGSW
jgi:hypothetical protein